MAFKIMDKALNVGVRAGSAAGGGISAKLLDKIPFINDLNPWIKGGIKIGIGAVIPEFYRKPNSKLTLALDSFGAGMVAVGVVDIAASVMPALVSGADTIITGVKTDETYEDTATTKVNGAGNGDDTNNIMGNVQE